MYRNDKKMNENIHKYNPTQTTMPIIPRTKPAIAIFGRPSFFLPIAPKTMPKIDPTMGNALNNPRRPKIRAIIPFVLLLLGL